MLVILTKQSLKLEYDKTVTFTQLMFPVIFRSNVKFTQVHDIVNRPRIVHICCPECNANVNDTWNISIFLFECFYRHYQTLGSADLGFLVRGAYPKFWLNCPKIIEIKGRIHDVQTGGANPWGREKTYYLARFLPKNERIWTGWGGGHASLPSLCIHQRIYK